MERGDRSSVACLFAGGESMFAGRALTLGADAAHHVRVRRLRVGDLVAVTDGAGVRADGSIELISPNALTVNVEHVERVDPLPAVHLLVPIADRDRMLWLAEKSVELAVSSWRPVLWQRSRSVSPRGEGEGFSKKVRLRMIAALTQSAGAWLPALFQDAHPDRALDGVPNGLRLLLDPAGEPLLASEWREPVTLAVGPEGGFEAEEEGAMIAAGFRRVSLAGSILRFETAGVAALAIARAALARLPERAR